MEILFVLLIVVLIIALPLTIIFFSPFKDKIKDMAPSVPGPESTQELRTEKTWMIEWKNGTVATLHGYSLDEVFNSTWGKPYETLKPFIAQVKEIPQPL